MHRVSYLYCLHLLERERQWETAREKERASQQESEWKRERENTCSFSLFELRIMEDTTSGRVSLGRLSNRRFSLATTGTDMSSMSTNYTQTQTAHKQKHIDAVLIDVREVHASAYPLCDGSLSFRFTLKLPAALPGRRPEIMPSAPCLPPSPPGWKRVSTAPACPAAPP